MTPLQTRLAQLIEREGPIPFARFMEAALYDPEHGFYTASRPRVGKEGDFFTNVSVGPLFGRLLALQLAELWRFQNRPPRWNLTEQGADRGLLSLDILSALRELAPECFEAVQLRIVEPAPILQAAQAETLLPFCSKVRWFSTLQALPPDGHGLFCNELLDAFPCHRLERVNQTWMERFVDCQDQTFEWTAPRPPSETLRSLLPLLPHLPDGFLAEACPGHAPWLQTCHEKIPEGWLLILDYGMSRTEWLQPHRRHGSLSAYAHHQRKNNPLDNPGEQDLTFHLNFTVLAHLARTAGWQIAGYLEQARFFTALAPHYFQEKGAPNSPAELRERLAFRTLVDPNLLGSRFKVLALHNHSSPLPAWTGLRFARADALELEGSDFPQSATSSSLKVL